MHRISTEEIKQQQPVQQTKCIILRMLDRSTANQSTEYMKTAIGPTTLHAHGHHNRCTVTTRYLPPSRTSIEPHAPRWLT